ncbi:atrial natriuretic peptide receptor 1-like [Paramacrobiotus metropolitanus]|uniref:atrial natriuretic peptide receptor 1-like n=1 Tax=Paramacrobiotus metropolitanus TaxID=2943436 RepID=UPI002445BAC8|nr:atrial natriuretic peptide receptor 1-like [Paramacrobiotus metropolitanus]
MLLYLFRFHEIHRRQLILCVGLWQGLQQVLTKPTATIHAVSHTNSSITKYRVIVLAMLVYNPEVIVPALKLAWNDLNNTSDVQFTLAIAQIPGCQTFEPDISGTLTKFYYEQAVKYDYFILLGAGCSNYIEIQADFAREWNVPLITSAGTDSKLQNKRRFPTLVRLLPSQIAEYSKCFARLLRHYRWRRIAIICDPASSYDPFFQQTCGDFEKVLIASLGQQRQPDVTYTINANLSIDSQRVKALEDARSRSRVIVVIAHLDRVRETLITAWKIGMNNSAYVYIATLNYNYDTPLRGSLHWMRNDSDDEIAQTQLKSLLVISLAHPVQSPKYIQFLQIINQTASQEYNVSNAITEETQLMAVCMHTAVHAFAEIINENSVNGNLTELPNGSAFSRLMYNRSFDAVSGLPFKMDGNGDRDAVYTVLAVTTNGTELEEYLYYDSYDGSRALYYAEGNITWYREYSLPPDFPECQYSATQEGCENKQDLRRLLPIYIVTPIVILLFLLGWIFLHIRNRRNKEADAWLIQATDVENLARSHFAKTLSVSRSRLFKAAEQHSISIVSQGKGHLVRWKAKFAWSKLYHTTVDKFQFSKNEQQLVLARMRMEHLNIAWFYGIVVNGTELNIISEFARKGSLDDILEAATLNQTPELTYSFLKGIVEGMCFIQASSVAYHGRLKPSNCLVDQRLSIRLTDFGLKPILDRTIKENVSDASNDTVVNTYDRSALYLAPEVLRSGALPETAAKYYKVDIYAFGIILHQILFRCGPFWIGNDKWMIELDEAVDMVKQANISPYRPLIPPNHKVDLGFISLMKECWAENPDTRLGFYQVRQRLAFVPGVDSNASLVDSIMERLELFAKKLEADVATRTAEYEQEKERTDAILCQIYPRSIVSKLQRGVNVPPEEFEEVTVCFTSISDFAIIIGHDSPLSVVAYLNDAFTMLDKIIEQYAVYKVETVGDSYLVVSGLPERNDNAHVSEIGKMSVVMIDESKELTFRGNRFGQLQLRIGIATGPCAAAIVGHTNPRFCLFGDTVNTASRMNSFGEALRIHISEATARCITKNLPSHDFQLTHRGQVPIKVFMVYSKEKGTWIHTG